MTESEKVAFIEALYRLADWAFDLPMHYPGLKLPPKAEHALHEALHMTILKVAMPKQDKTFGMKAIMSTDVAVMISMMPKHMSRLYEIRTLAAEIRVIHLLDGFEDEKGPRKFLIGVAKDQKIRSLRTLVEERVESDQAKADAAAVIRNVLEWAAY